jgi:hypothetical protein
MAGKDCDAGSDLSRAIGTNDRIQAAYPDLIANRFWSHQFRESKRDREIAEVLRHAITPGL